MIVESITINNFKSIGNECNTIIVEPNITALIGKNESGKSNILEALSYINFLSRMRHMSDKNFINRDMSFDEKEMSYVVNLVDKRNNKTCINIKANSINVEGYLFNAFTKEVFPKLKELVSFLDTNPFNFRSYDYDEFIKQKKILSKESLDTYELNEAFVYFNNKFLNSSLDDENINIFTSCYEQWKKIIDRLPVFFIRNEKRVLSNQYDAELVKSEYNRSDSLLKDFLECIHITKEVFLECIAANTDFARSKQSTINKNIDKYINLPFNQFYHEEKVKLSINFTSGRAYFEVESNDNISISLNERSNGLRWYLNLFIDIISHDLENKNVIFLFDEPGISLHINAQKEILKLFNDLSSKSNQIIYSTHLPSMLSLSDNGIHRIRAIEKDENGISKIYKTAYDFRISKSNIDDTISPLLEALGTNMNNTFIFSKDKINVICEGMSDYIYLSELLKKTTYENEIVFIPSVGANQISNIFCILTGWKLPVIALFDFDREGINNGEGKFKKELDLELNKDYLYIKEIVGKEIELKEYIQTPYRIEEFIGNDMINNFKHEQKVNNEISKVLLAKLMMDSMKDGSFKIDDDLLDRAKLLFERIIKANRRRFLNGT